MNLINFHSKGLIDWNNDSRLSLNSELEDHHIFPKAYLEKHLNDSEKDFIDCVGNRTLVPKKLNIKISAKRPSEYLSEIKVQNEHFENTLSNHLIPKDMLSGELDNEFLFFLEMRSEDIFKIIQENVIEPFQSIKDRFYEEVKVDESSNISVFGTYRNNKAEATFNPVTKETIYKGKLFDSPSAAAISVKQEFGASDEASENGWTFWKFINDNGEEKKITEFRQG